MHHHRFSSAATMIAMVALLALSGCTDTKPEPTAPSQEAGLFEGKVPPEVQKDIDNLRRVADSPDRGVAYWTNTEGNRPAIVVPAGSVDALAAAIAAAGDNGKVILASGEHTENSTVTITQKVTIVGENGATLKSAVPHHNGPVIIVYPAIYVHGATGVTIWNINFRPTGAVGGTAIMLENAPRTTVGANSIEEFQFGVLLQNSHSSTLVRNRVAVNFGWTTGDPIECDGIININGVGVRIADNDVSNSLLGVFCSGSDGFFMHNLVHNNFVGMILCKVPASSFQLPSGAVVGSDISAKGWFVQGNNGTDNFYTAYMVIDGANNNLLVNNAASGNAEYDMELLGETCLFGFSTPTSFNNTVVMGQYHDISVNDFGLNNRIIGATNVTNDISAPCP